MRIVLLPLALLAAACSGAKDDNAMDDIGDPAQIAPGGTDSPDPSPPPRPAPIATATPNTAPTDAPAGYAGRWATLPEMCEHGAWRFEPRRLVTAGEVACDFTRVTPVADGYDVDARCLAEGARSDETVRLRFAGKTMTVTSKMWPGVPLQKCG